MKDNATTVLAHIGGGKAGSTAIQSFLFLNRSILQQHGVAVPNQDCEFADGRADQIRFFEELRKSKDPGKELVEKIDKVCAEFTRVTGQHPSTVTLSAENLSVQSDPLRLFAQLKEKYQITAVLYVRSQEETYQAAWQQWYSKQRDTLEQWLQKTDGSFCDWDAIVSRWKAIAGDRVVVRIFGRGSQRDWDVRKDFCDLFFPQVTSLKFPKLDSNASFGAHISHLNNSIPGFFKDQHDNRFTALLRRLRVESARKRPGEWIFTREQLDFIRARHALGNAHVKQAYFSDLPGEDLFPPVPATEKTGISIEELNSRNIAVLAELLTRHILEAQAEPQRQPEKKSVWAKLGFR